VVWRANRDAQGGRIGVVLHRNRILEYERPDPFRQPARQVRPPREETALCAFISLGLWWTAIATTFLFLFFLIYYLGSLVLPAHGPTLVDLLQSAALAGITAGVVWLWEKWVSAGS
jgi:hypothetical protein